MGDQFLPDNMQVGEFAICLGLECVGIEGDRHMTDAAGALLVIDRTVDALRHAQVGKQR